MNSHKFTQKWAIISLLENATEGSEFHYTEFPLHVTLAGVFKVSHNGDRITDELSTLLKDQKSVAIKAKAEVMLGTNHDIAAMKIEQSAELLNLYNKIHNWLVVSGAVYNEPQYQGEGYLPHSTHQKSGRLLAGQEAHITSVSIIDLLPKGDGYKRRIHKTIDFAA